MINLKWSMQKHSFIIKTLNFLLFLIIYTAETIYMFPNRIHPLRQSDYKTSIGLSILVILYCLYCILAEINQWKNVGTHIYWRTTWNYIDWCSILFTIPAYILNVVDLSSESGLDYDSLYTLKSLLSLATFVNYIKMLSFGRGFDATSYLIRVLQQVILDIRVFIFIFFFMILTLSFSGII